MSKITFNRQVWSARLIAYIVAAAIATTALTVGTAAPESEALTGADFDPSYIISDELFFDSSAMTQPQIQAFLDAKIGACANSSCLSILRTDSSSRPADAMCSGYVGVAGERAAAIIYNVQRSCGISAKVLLVTLQKEQGLATSSGPSSSALRIAMGYGCPDTSECDSFYFGFFNQVYNAARQLKRYTLGAPDNISFHYYDPGTASRIAYNPSSACGASIVYIKNKATSALYYYTPYQPNSAALANLGGVGDGCSSYGNRNFWWFYSNWFGSPTVNSEKLINDKYAALGGASGYLGAAVTGFISYTANGGGVGRAYAGGSIYSSRIAGVFVVTGVIRTEYWRLLGETGALGWPISDPIQITASGGGIGQAFQFGSIYWSNATGAVAVTGQIRDRYWAMGGETGPLGFPKSAAAAAAGGGQQQAFVGGTVLWSPSSGAHAVVKGPIGDLYQAQKGLAGALGYPLSEVLAYAANGGGSAQAFVGGSVYSSAAGGAHSVLAGLLTYYWTLGGESGSLGWPIGDQMCGLPSAECSQKFQGGTIYWSASQGGRVGSSEIEKVYAALGGVSGVLGARQTGLIAYSANGGGVAQGYVGGSIYSTASDGAHAVIAGILSYYWSRGGEGGVLGWPAGDQTCGLPNGECSQRFQGGTVYWSASKGGRVSSPEIDAAYGALGGATGVLGAPTTGVLEYSANGGGVAQAFAGGSIYSTKSGGTHAVLPGILAYYWSRGGEAGSLGWPTGDQDCTRANGECSQPFQGGTIVWSASKGGWLSSAEIDAVYSGLGGASGVLGAATTGVLIYTANGGGVAQGFVGGSIYSTKSSGTHAVLPGLLGYYWSRGGEAGSLGWPTGDQVCGLANAECSQKFQGGTIYWSATQGGRG